MTVYLGNNPFMKLYALIENVRNDLRTRIWRRKSYHVTCCMCGKTLKSDVDKYSPEECGWAMAGNKYFWICHHCLYHRKDDE